MLLCGAGGHQATLPGVKNEEAPVGNHISWSSIELLHNVILYFQILQKNTGAEIPTVTYRAKVKLHGTNCGVQIGDDGITTQSREMILTPKDDYKGFSKWVLSEEAYFTSLPKGYTIFGEWAGPGIEQGMAVSEVVSKIFAVFALQEGYGENAKVIFHPSDIEKILGKTPPNMYVLPFEAWDPITVDFSSTEKLEEVAKLVNGLVQQAEDEDPWIKRTFGISGLGEGIVLYPVALPHSSEPLNTDPENFPKMMWKAKGKKHKNTNTKEAVQVNVEVLNSISAFVDFMVTEARLDQGLQKVCGGVVDKKLTQQFLLWIVKDVQKESAAELEASGMTWAQVEKAVQSKARDWFKSKA